MDWDELNQQYLPYITAAVPAPTLVAAWQLGAGFAALADTGEHNWLVVEGDASRLEYVRLLSAAAEIGSPVHTAAIPTELAEQLQVPGARRWFWMWREQKLRSLPMGCEVVEGNDYDQELSRFLQVSAADASVQPGDPELNFWVLHRNPEGELDAVAGGVTWNSGAAVVVSVAVLPASRRQGLGRAVTLVATSEHFARGANRVSLGVRGSNIPAQELYRSIGFDCERDFTSIRLAD